MFPWLKKAPPPPAKWPFALPSSLTSEQVEAIRQRADDLEARSQYGFGHTIDFGPFAKEGVLKENFLTIVGHLDAWKWWPRSLRGMRIADIGCCTGGVSALMAHRGAAEIIGIEQIPEFADQCRLLAEVFDLPQIKVRTVSLYDLPKEETGKFDLVLLSGVLYHLSDMLVGLLVMRDLLKVGGTLLIESSAEADDEHSYANFGRYARGIWWNPSTLCLRDMCEFMGFSDVQVRMYWPDRALARAVKKDDDEIKFKRGVNYAFENLRDAVERTMEISGMAPK